MKTLYGTIARFEGYRFGDDGSAWSRLRGGRWRKLRPRPNSKGQLRVALRAGGRTHDLYLARLILEAFVGPCPEGMEACHDPDPNPANNRLSNLRWDTHLANIGDSERQGRRLKGSDRYNAILDEEKVKMIRYLSRRGVPLRRIALLCGVAISTAGDAIHRRSWRHVPSPGPGGK